MNHNPESFEDPETFIPERWLGDARFESDNHDAFQPFGVGPRSCAGRRSVKLCILGKMSGC